MDPCGHITAVSVLTGAQDKSYAIGLTMALVARGVAVEYVGSDLVDDAKLHGNALIRFLNLRGSQREDAGAVAKALRVWRYYVRLLAYAVCAKPRVFHILWNNKFDFLDRTALMLFYRLCRRKLVLTAHNVNAAKRDGRDNWLNRLSLRVQYSLAHHIFVHTEKMKDELEREFGMPARKISVIPFGINDTLPRTNLSSLAARQRLGLEDEERVLLFFGQIAPYKGLHHLIQALPKIRRQDPRVRLIVAGKVKRGSERYWQDVLAEIDVLGVGGAILKRIEHIPDSDVEIYFKAADVLVLPYLHISQSGVPFLSYSFGLPVLAADVGELRADVVEGVTGFVFRSQDPDDIQDKVVAYFASPLYMQLPSKRREIRAHALARHSWSAVADITTDVYLRLSAHTRFDRKASLPRDLGTR
jgi:glycosyltransferase involved in cell wall biosynthesis